MKWKILFAVLAGLLLTSFGARAGDAAVMVKITARAPMQALDKSGHPIRVSMSAPGTTLTLVEVSGAQLVLKAPDGTGYKIAASATDYIPPARASADSATPSPTVIPAPESGGAAAAAAGDDAQPKAEPDAPRDDLPVAPDGYEWKLNPALSDEFNAPTLDGSKWNANHAFWVGRVPSRFEKNNVSVADGNLLLRSASLVDDLSRVKNPQKDIWIAAACLASNKPIASYGFYEARIKASDLAMTSSFWFQGPTPYSVERTSEIDVVEEMGNPVIRPEQRLLMMSNSHFFEHWGATDLGTPSSWKMPTAAADGYHVYGVWWKDAHTATFFHDGRQVGEVTFKGDFTVPMSLYFDTEAFTWDGLPTIASLRDEQKNTMRVDWVRSWTLEKK